MSWENSSVFRIECGCFMKLFSPAAWCSWRFVIFILLIFLWPVFYCTNKSVVQIIIWLKCSNMSGIVCNIHSFTFSLAFIYLSLVEVQRSFLKDVILATARSGMPVCLDKLEMGISVPVYSYLWKSSTLKHLFEQRKKEHKPSDCQKY